MSKKAGESEWVQQVKVVHTMLLSMLKLKNTIYRYLEPSYKF